MDGGFGPGGPTTARTGCLARALCGVTRADGGAIALEFALIAPLLIVLFGGLVEFGNIFLVKSEMTSAAREAVRRLSVSAVTEKQAIAFVDERLATVSDATFKVAVDETELDDDRFDLTVAIQVPLADVMWLDLDGLLGLVGGEAKLETVTLTASATMLQE